MPMVSAATTTAMNTITHHLGTTLVTAVANPALGTLARAVTATGGGATTNIKANIKMNGITPGTTATTTAVAEAMSIPTLNDSATRWVRRTAASISVMAITRQVFPLRGESRRLA